MRLVLFLLSCLVLAPAWALEQVVPFRYTHVHRSVPAQRRLTAEGNRANVRTVQKRLVRARLHVGEVAPTCLACPLAIPLPRAGGDIIVARSGYVHGEWGGVLLRPIGPCGGERAGG